MLSVEVMAAGGATRVGMKNSWGRVGGEEAHGPSRDEQDGSPELGSQGSMSSSSLGHSADATSRSSADCGEKTKTVVRPKAALFCCCHLVVVVFFFFYCL